MLLFLGFQQRVPIFEIASSNPSIEESDALLYKQLSHWVQGVAQAN